jgi:hypothetical protein
MNARRAITAVFFVNGALLASWTSRIPALATRVHADNGVLGLVLLVPALGAVMAMPWVGRLLPGRRSRTFCQVALAALTMAVALPGLATSVVGLTLALLAVGVANATLDVSMNAHGVSVERQLGRPVLSSLHAAFSFGGFAGAGIGALAAALHIAPASHLAVAAVLFGGPALIATRYLLPRDADSDADAPRLRLTHLPSRLALLGTACFFCFLAEGGAADWSAQLVHDDLAGSAALGAAAYSAFAGAMAVGRLVSDGVWARWGAVKLLRRCGLLAAVGFAAGLSVGSAAAAVAGFAVLGLGLSGVVPTLFRASAGQPRVPTGTAIAAASSLGYTGFLAGPPIVGAVAQLTSLRLACGLFVLSGLLVLALASAARTPRESRPAPQPVLSG